MITLNRSLQFTIFAILELLKEMGYILAPKPQTPGTQHITVLHNITSRWMIAFYYLNNNFHRTQSPNPWRAHCSRCVCLENLTPLSQLCCLTVVPPKLYVVPWRVKFLRRQPYLHPHILIVVYNTLQYIYTLCFLLRPFPAHS